MDSNSGGSQSYRDQVEHNVSSTKWPLAILTIDLGIAIQSQLSTACKQDTDTFVSVIWEQPQSVNYITIIHRQKYNNVVTTCTISSVAYEYHCFCQFHLHGNSLVKRAIIIHQR